MSDNAEQLISNYEKLIEIINDETYLNETESDKYKKAQILKFHQDQEELIITAPASGNTAYHNCFPGGYTLHVLNVINACKSIEKAWSEMSPLSINYTRDELITSALLHDIGKITNLTYEIFVPETDEWQRKKRGSLYRHNDLAMPWFEHTDLSLWLCNQYDIKLTQNEFHAIKLHAGLYLEGNKNYYQNWESTKRIKLSLTFILHQADLLSTQCEQIVGESALGVATKAQKKTAIDNAKAKTQNKVNELFAEFLQK